MRLPGIVCVLSLVSCASDARDWHVVDVQDVETSPSRDVLLVIDTSAELEGQRVRVADELAATLRVLVSGDFDSDGESDLGGAHEVRVAITSAATGCGDVTRIGWRDRDDLPGDPDAFAAAVSGAITALPRCDRSRPMARAAEVLPSLHRDGAESLIVAVTDEDEPDARTHVDALVRAHAGFRPALVVAVVGGVPLEAVGLPLVGVDASGCSRAGTVASAMPGLMFALRHVEARGSVAELLSYCQSSWLRVLDTFAVRLVGVDTCHCIPDDAVACRVEEQLSASERHQRCDRLAGRDPIPIGASEEGAERCTVLEVEGEWESGWRWVGRDRLACRDCAPPRAIRWGMAPEPGSRIEVVCSMAAP